jgi:hypothetical protein
MRVDPLMQLNELINSVFEAIGYTSTVVLAITLAIVGALELRSRLRRPQRSSSAGDRAAARDRDGRRRSDRVAPAAH